MYYSILWGKDFLVPHKTAEESKDRKVCGLDLWLISKVDNDEKEELCELKVQALISF